MLFLKRSEPDHAMVSVRLRRIDGRARGEVFLPMRQRGETLTTASLPDGGALSAAEALGLATTHAFDLRTDVAVVDDEGLWRPEWGTLRQAPAPAPETEEEHADSGAATEPEEEHI